MTKEGIKRCQNCKQSFTIAAEDFAFYERIKVPPPTFCPDCRFQRRLLFRNESVLYKANDAITGNEMLSIYSPDKPYTIFSRDYWWSDAWDPRMFGKEYDFSRPFFAQFNDLLHKVPRPNLLQTNVVNSPFAHSVLNLKNCYMIFAADTAEDSQYCRGANLHFKNSMDLHQSLWAEWCYELIDCSNCNRVLFARNCEHCVDSVLLYDCKNCSNCFGCVGLRNKSYCIFNVQYEKEEYARRLKELNIGSFTSLQAQKAAFDKLAAMLPRRYAQIIKSVDCTGDDIINSKNCHFCFYSKNTVENCKFTFRALNMNDGMDLTIAWNNSELFYEDLTCYGHGIYFSSVIWGGHDVYYSDYCFDSHNIFGCVGLRKASYCILNRQYTKEEYETLVPKIIAHMNEVPYVDQKGRTYCYGEFFPAELSPFGYNESMVQDYFPLTKEQAAASGYKWQEARERNYHITKRSSDLPDHIKDVTDDILKETVGCVHGGTCTHQCTTAFRIVLEELAFYRKMNLPLPRLCPSCRHYERLAQRNPLKLWHRKCQCAGGKSENGVYTNTVTHPHHKDSHCPNEFETSYAPDRKEIVYCESCYNAEVV